MGATSNSARNFASGIDEAADRIRGLNEKLIDTAKKSGTASLDAYEQGLTGLIDFQQQVAGATQLDWVKTVVKAQTDYFSETSAAYTAVAREALK